MVLKKIYTKANSVQRIIFPDLQHRMRLYYADHYESTPIESKTILYETRDGKSIVDSPLAIFNYLTSDDRFSDFNHIWVIDKDAEGIKNTISEPSKKKVKFVYRDTLDYVDALLKAKYLISNSTFESFFVKRSDQIYINTWHGTPLKYMGFDIPGSVSHSQNVLRNFLMTDYILSPNAHTSNIFINSYKLKGIYSGEILEGGYPRIDSTLSKNKDSVYEKLESVGVDIRGDRKKILYCPTWKGQNVHQATDDIEQIVNETLRLKEKFYDEYDVLVKVHPFIYNEIKNDSRLFGLLISDLIDANEVLSIIDVLITDYSSIFFDFLVTKKPIIFYAWDKDLYSFERGMYLTNDELPGPTAENFDELLKLIQSVEVNHTKYQKKYEELAQRMVPYEDGHVTKKYVEYIFKKQDSKNITVHTVNSKKKKLLIFPGGMRNNGITSSFLNLTNNIDYTKYDVTVICNPSSNDEINNNLKAMNKNIRPLFRFGIDILTRKEKLVNKKFADQGVEIDQRSNYPENGYRREMNRLVGNLKFDVAIDFSGYSYFWGRHILGADAKKYIVFMHNDLYSDSRREVNGKMPMFKDLNGLFSIYYKFDKLLSVSPMTRDVNYSNLKKYVSKEQMSYVYNTINIEKILEKQLLVEDKQQLIVKRGFLQFESSGIIEYALNINCLRKKSFSKKEVSKESTVVQYASFYVNDELFFKVSVDNMYLGWIPQKYVIPKEISTQRIEDFHGFATVSRFLNYPIWKDIKTNTKKDKIISYVRPFKNRYFEIEKVAYTDAGRYFYVKYNQKPLGWVSPRPLMRIHETSRYSPINSYFMRRTKKLETIEPVYFTDLVESTNFYGKIKNIPNIELWSAPKGITGSESIPFSEEYLEQPFKINEISYVGSNKFYKLLLNNDTSIGYIDSKFIIEISEEDFKEADDKTEKKLDTNFVLPKVDLGFQKVPSLDKNYFNIVNMGRLSPEKNQKNLIEAFAEFRQENPKSRLYILGKGPLEKELIQCIKDTNQEGSVFMLGHLSSPFNFIKETDLFVLPSYYEGQPMVLLESMTLGMKILASNIPANINVLGKEEEYGLLTKGTSPEDIKNGLLRALSHKGDFTSFDPYKYNKEAIKSFYNEIN
ncbi:CDP-glycerol glycerophosphotransferase family protein [Enterococcus casseliflavus]|uniref:CDP-glycerol glycerophosphotransferase family protein n=1 Tax=Enterococcus casseliflavus TaxID=37734 RepID=UPI001BCE67FB|nr:CDP-glycerol glycerophosphotransferase family protein [Enterococcus casseliflavus]WBY91099.1 CDP-glycerol glycerophosphotransferase family protein [Enterococcus casseliflavus]